MTKSLLAVAFALGNVNEAWAARLFSNGVQIANAGGAGLGRAGVRGPAGFVAVRGSNGTIVGAGLLARTPAEPKMDVVKPGARATRLSLKWSSPERDSE